MIKFIDVHAHGLLEPGYPCFNGGQPFPSPDELLAKYDALGIEKGCILPETAPESPSILNTQSNEDIWRFCQTHPDRFIPFCNVDPRNLFNNASSPFGRVLKYYKEKGFKGIGEVTCNLHFLDPRVQAFLKGAEEAELSVTFQISPFPGENYGLVDRPGLPELEECLRKFPKLKFFGHSQAFWCEIGAYTGQNARFGYPHGPVTEGRIATLMRRYPNLYGDLSAGSGANALMRDRAYGIRFMNEFQDRLMFGMDIARPNAKPSPLPVYLRELLASGELSETVFRKIARDNAIRLLGLEA